MAEILKVIGSDDDYEDAVSGELCTNSSNKDAHLCKGEIPNSKAEVNNEIATHPTNLDSDDCVPNIDNVACGSDLKENFVDSPLEDINEEIDEKELEEKEKSMSPEELDANKVKADKMKLEANELFKNNQAAEAIKIYTEALKICPVKDTKARAVLFGNRAAAKIKLDLKKNAMNDCNKALELWPQYVRVLIRRAKLYEHEDKLDEALADYKQVYDLDPGQNEAREAMVRLPPIIDERNERLKAEMLDKLKDLGNMILKPFGLSTSNFQMQQDPSTGSYSINFQNKS